MLLRKGAGALALGLLMLTQTEAAGLNIHGLNPQLRTKIGSLADSRPVILARAPYAVYSSGTSALILSYTFPPGSLAVGDMVRITATGVVINNNGAATNMSVGLSSIGGGQASGQNVAIASVAFPIAGGNPNLFCQWRLETIVSVGVPNAQGQNYVPQLNVGAVTQRATYSSGLQPLNAYNFVGSSWLFGTDSALSGAVFSGGRILTGATGTSALGLQRPLIYDNTVPVELDITITVPNFATMPVTVTSGVMEGL